MIVYLSATPQKSPAIDSPMTTSDTPPLNAENSVVPESPAINQAPVTSAEITNPKVLSPDSPAKKLLTSLQPRSLILWPAVRLQNRTPKCHNGTEI